MSTGFQNFAVLTQMSLHKLSSLEKVMQPNSRISQKIVFAQKQEGAAFRTATQIDTVLQRFQSDDPLPTCIISM